VRESQPVVSRHVFALTAAAIVAALVACGSAAAGDGARVWTHAKCGDCHTLAAAGAAGTAGPNLDQLRPSAAAVVAQVTKGGGGMPSYAGLGGLPIDALAVYVASVAGQPAATASPPVAAKVKATSRPPVSIAPSKHSAAIKRLQLQLQQLGFFHGPVTGFYGAQTTAAVKRFQLAVHLQADGVWGALSSRALERTLQQAATVRRVVARAKTAPLPPPAPWVKQLQTKLHRLGLFHHPVTGVYGPVTTAAVATFQLRMGLAIDGRWGPKSQRALVRRLAGR
jgi:peptidoglycan hydrolase-like protein with peptidoglycan-binding domain